MTYQYETHIFKGTHTDRYGIKTEREYPEIINVNATHLVMLDMDAEGDESPIFAIRAFDASEAYEIMKAHHLTEMAIWYRTPERTFAPLVNA